MSPQEISTWKYHLSGAGKQRCNSFLRWWVSSGLQGFEKVLAWTDWSGFLVTLTGCLSSDLGYSSCPMHSIRTFLCVVAGKYETKMCLNSCVGGKLHVTLISYNSSNKSTFTGFRVIEQFVPGFTNDWTWKTRIRWGIWRIFGKETWKPRIEGW